MLINLHFRTSLSKLYAIDQLRPVEQVNQVKQCCPEPLHHNYPLILATSLWIEWDPDLISMYFIKEEADQ